MMLFAVIFLMFASSVHSDIAGLPSEAYVSLGDINIGGLFPLHQPGANGAFCGSLRELGVLQRAEAMAFFINSLNKQKFLTNVSLGYIILDDCYKESTALAQTLKFIRRSPTSKDNKTTAEYNDVVAVIGAESSANSKQVAELLGLFEIPQISYLSTSPTLSDEIVYPYFNRIVPSDELQVAAMIEVLRKFHWRYVSFVYTVNYYGLDAYLLLLKKLRESSVNICLAADIPLLEILDNGDYEDVIHKLTSNNHGDGGRAHVVILFVNQITAINILKAADRMKMRGQFTWVASDAWGRNVHDFAGVEEIAEGSLVFRINSTNDSEFDSYFSQLNPSKSSNPYMGEFWEEAYNQSDRGGAHLTFKDLKAYQPETTVSLVKIAIYVLADRLRDMQKECIAVKAGGNDSECYGKGFRNYVNGSDLQVKLRGLKGCINATCFSIDKNGQGLSEYSVMNLQRSSGARLDLKKIAYYENGHLNLMNTSDTALHWNPYINATLIKDGVPLSECSLPCSAGHRQVRNVYNSKCCWNCEKCETGEVSFIGNVSGQETALCKPCENMKPSNYVSIYHVPTADLTTCTLVVPEYLSFSDAAAVNILVIDSICMGLTLLVLYVYIVNRKHRLIKATSRELSYVIWFGIIFSYISLIFYFMPLQKGCTATSACEPSLQNHWCYIQYITFALSSTFITAPVITRANRIYRIFREGKKYAGKPKYIENKFQFMIVAVLISIQAFIVFTCCLTSHMIDGVHSIKLRSYLHVENSTSYIYCDIPYTLLLPPLLFNFMLCSACAYHAFKTRKLPDNFNESKFIGMTMYTTVITWVALVSAYITLGNGYYKVIPLSVALIINSIIACSFLFIPKVYALRWVDKSRMHVRSNSTSISSVYTESKNKIRSASDTSLSFSKDSGYHSSAINVNDLHTELSSSSTSSPVSTSGSF